HHLDAERVVRAAGGDAGLGELLGQHDGLGLGEAGAAVLGGPAGGEQVVVGQGLAPPLRPVVDLVAGQGADALPVRREVLGEERLDLLAVLLGLGPPRGLHGGKSATGTPARTGGQTMPMSTPRARSDTAAAPTSGPPSPRPAGTTRVPAVNSRWQRRSTSACAASKKAGP